ncbi:MAG: nucleotidyltransferase family protein [Croceibacterium sp.]
MPSWTAILLAGERPDGDPLARHYGVSAKALLPIGGISMIRRVSGTLLAVPQIGRVVILAQDPAALLSGDMADIADDPRLALAQSGYGIASSIAAVVGTERAPWPVMVTTADHALLTPEMVTEFLAGTEGCDLAVAVGERRVIEAAYPETRRTWLKFSDGHYSGANLFALRSPKVASALRLWSGVEQDRKRALKLFRRFGPWLLLRAVTRTISFPNAMTHAGKRLGLIARPVVLSAAEAAIDVDKPDDVTLVESILRSREGVQTVDRAG